MTGRPELQFSPGDSLRMRVESVLGKIRPAIHADGGDLELVDVDDQGLVQVRLLGACVGCPSSAQTLTLGVERNLREHIPEITKVVCI